jgi:hypothetical protein
MIIRRQQQEELIAQAKESIKKLDDKSYVVHSQSGNGSYNIQIIEQGFVCSCADHLYRDVKCKHIHAVEFCFVAAFPDCQKHDSIVIEKQTNSTFLLCF